MIKVASGYRIQVRQEFNEWVSRLWKERPQRYSRALLETIARPEIALRVRIAVGEVSTPITVERGEISAVATAAVIVSDPPPNFSVLSAHKYIPPVMEIVAEMPATRVEGFLAAGHAATITGSALFEPFVERHGIPVVVAGFEPLDVLAGLLKLVELVRDGEPQVVNMYPRCVTPEGNRNAQEQLWRVFRTVGGRWRGIAHVPNGNLRLRDEFAHVDTRKRFKIDVQRLWTDAPSALTQVCICGDIMAGIASPDDCDLFEKECTPDAPVGACMVSNEGTCKIWHQYGGHPDL